MPAVAARRREGDDIHVLIGEEVFGCDRAQS